MPDVTDILFDDPQNDHGIAEELAAAYVRASEQYYFPLPTAFGATEEEMMKDAVEDFIGFIREWRKRAITVNKTRGNEPSEKL